MLRRLREQAVTTGRLAIEQSVQSVDWTGSGWPQCPPRFALGERTVDLERHLITIGNFQVSLTQLECRLLERMWAKRNRTIPSEILVDVLWGPDARRGTHSLRSLVKNIRRKLEPDPGRPQYLVVDRTIGYRLNVR